MKYPKVLTVQDISCVGQCSLTVALPILSVCGAETCVFPSAVLSTHTAGFHGFVSRDMAQDMMAFASHWEREGIRFDAIYTGYLGTKEQFDYILDMYRRLGNPGCRLIVDPVLGDFGKLYPAFDEAYAEAIRPLCFSADVLLPNLTEACILTGIPYQANYDEAYISEILGRLAENGAGTVVFTGCSFDEDTTGVMVMENGKLQYYRHKKIDRLCHGTGDIFASVFTGAYMQGLDVFSAAKTAADFTLLCIERTQDDDSHWYGMKFETALPVLPGMLQNAERSIIL